MHKKSGDINDFLVFYRFNQLFDEGVKKAHVTPCHRITFRLNAHNAGVIRGHLA